MMFPKPEKRVKVKKPLKRKSRNPLPIAKDRAWKAFSVWIRLSNADENGNTACFTCGRAYPWKLTQAGHFIHDCMDFNIYNIHPQCARCNKWLQGNGVIYAEKLLSLYGQEIVDELFRLKYVLTDYSVQDYLDIEKKYKDKVKEL